MDLKQISNNRMRIFFMLLIIMISIPGKSQYFENTSKSESFIDKLFFGGGLGLSFGQVTQIEVSPIVGYKLTKRLHPGVGFSYSYYYDKRFTVPLEFSTYSGSVFTRFFLLDAVFAYAEAEFLNTKIHTFISGQIYSTQRKWIESYLVGGGYYQKIGQRSGMYLMILWNLNETEYTPYSNPLFRMGFNF
jgi:hypothetical protein